MQKNNSISAIDIDLFKTQNCNENTIIIDILKKDVKHHMKEPILDVGAGLGDIALSAFAAKKAYLIDVNDFSAYPVSENHQRIIGNFWDFNPDLYENVKTIFMGHTLQCIDDDMGRLNDHIQRISPQYIICVQNQNNDYFGAIIDWLKENIPEANPEIWHKDFPLGYSTIKKFPFQGEMKFKNFEEMADQLLKVIMLASPTDEKRKEFINKLSWDLTVPALIINESITVYERN